ncbi:MAG: hypothetical protein PHC64_04340 [Candidatus Gastranaerophilales bacterium]|nr:hypothetical protein [Candidatus Gastranaerophilales bacterium]
MKSEYKIEEDKIRALIKSLVSMEEMTLTKLKILINHKFNKSDSLENLTNKLRNKTIRATELLQIFEILGYELIVRKK